VDYARGVFKPREGNIGWREGPTHKTEKAKALRTTRIAVAVRPKCREPDA
jgi:hypothetical protein